MITTDIAVRGRHGVALANTVVAVFITIHTNPNPNRLNRSKRTTARRGDRDHPVSRAIKPTVDRRR